MKTVWTWILLLWTSMWGLSSAGAGDASGEISSRTSVVKEFNSTTELYAELQSTGKYSFVYVYTPDCPWCEELTPKIWEMSSFFIDKINFIMIDGNKARNMDRDLNVESYPSLFLFEAVSTAKNTHLNQEFCLKDLLIGIYHGEKDIAHMTYYLAELTGESPLWPDSWDNNVFGIKELSSMKDFDAIESSQSASLVEVLSFTTPWMGFYYQKLFQYQEMPLLIENAQFFDSRLKSFRIDGSSNLSSNLTNLFRITHFPTLVLLPHTSTELNSSVVVIEFHKYDSEILGKELEVVRQVTNFCINGDAKSLLEYNNEFHSIEVYQSLEQMQYIVNGANEANEANDEMNVETNEQDLDNLICSIRDM